VGSNPLITASFFYGDGCSHCENVKPLLADLSARYPDLRIEMLEVYRNSTNLEKFSAMSRQYGIENAGIPTLFIGTTALVGDTDIKDHFEENILAEKQRLATCTTTTAPVNTTSGSPVPDCPPGTTSLTPQLVIVSACIDSINPCAFAVLIFLLLSLSAAESRRRILLVGTTYVLALFLFHLIAGVGVFSLVTLSGYSRVFSFVGATLAVLFGILTIVDVLKNRENYLLGIPVSKKEIIGQFVRTASVPAAFVLGILAGVFGFSCTGGIYISILALMSREFTLMSGLPYLLLYNIVFILPLVLVVLLIAFGVSPEKANTWRLENRRILRLVVGLAMIALGIIIFSGWIG
jgi:cytochrome c biogenesis protein CcdA